MVIREVNEERWESLRGQFVQCGNGAPLSHQYAVEMNCNGVEYILKIQLGRGREIALLEALEVLSDRELGGKDYLLVDEAEILSALLEILLYQGAAKRG